MTTIRPVILSGGSGTRLWPLSTPEIPKQFAALVGDSSLFEATIQRLHGRPSVGLPIVVTGTTHTEAVAGSARRAGIDLEALVVEPEGRNTAPACVAAALVAEAHDILVILPSDHLISDVEGFATAVISASEQATRGLLVTFGIAPDRPETGYGYIELGDEVGGAHAVIRFKEKPDLEEAERLVEAGGHVWNSGMFVVSASTLIEEAGAHCPEILDAVARSITEPEEGIVTLGDEFRAAERISLDHAIMEKTDRAVVIPIDVGWNDIGSYEALWAVSEKDVTGNFVSEGATVVDVRNSYVRATSRTVAVAGLDDVVVVETDEAVLVIAKDKSQLVRDLVDRLDAD